MARLALIDAWQAVRQLTRQPTRSLPVVCESLGGTRARAVGIVFAIGFAMACALAIRAALPDWLRPEAGDYLGVLLVGLVPPAALVAAAVCARALIHGSGSIATDSFYATATLLPVGVALLVASITGFGNFDVIMGLAVFAATIAALMLFAGYTRIASAPEHKAIWLVPAMLIATAWATKMVVTAIIL